MESCDPQTEAPVIEDLFHRYQRRITQFYCSHGIPYQTSIDLAQDTFVQATRGIGEFRGDSPPSVWLWRIARNNLVSYFRRSRRPEVEINHDELAAPDAADPGSARNTLAECIARGFRSFSRDYPERADVLRITIIEGWSIREVASFLGRTEGATRQYISQCRKYIRPYLEHCHGA